MKRFILALIALLLFFVEANCQNEYLVSVKIGVPKASKEDRESFSFFADVSVSKEVVKNTYLGLGIGYLQNDQARSNMSLTFDNKVISSYISLYYKIRLFRIFVLSPELQTGYAFFESSLNEYKYDIKWNNGFLIGGVTNWNILLTKKIQLVATVGLFSILKKQITYSNFNHDTFIDTMPRNVNIRKLGIGIQIAL